LYPQRFDAAVQWIYDRNMRLNLGSRHLFIGILFTLAGTFGSATFAQDKVVKKVTVQDSAAWKGDDLYKEFCAVCHGADGRGQGPAASALKELPTDLTLIARRNGGKFSDIHMRQVIAGDTQTPAHGSKDMPMWGDVFKSISANRTFAEMRVNALVDYLKKIQR
jgi:mono/diheme cytochrome c family protein